MHYEIPEPGVGIPQKKKKKSGYKKDIVYETVAKKHMFYSGSLNFVL